MEIKGLGSGYADPDNVYYNLGLWGGETYELSVVYILKSGRGNTPAFPIRGGDNIDGGLVYTAGDIDTDDGFVGTATADSENRLGVYRTNRKRTMLTGADSGTTVVKKLQVDVSSLLSNADIQRETEGFFFVRKKRDRDCVIQGYITNTVREPLSDKVSTEGPTFYSMITYSGIWTKSPEHLSDLREAIGISNRLDGTYPGKILPAPGRIWETTHHGGSIPPARGASISMQGKVNPSPSDTLDINSGEHKDVHYAFYSADMLADPKLSASIFNNSTKGLMIDKNPIVMEQIIAPGVTFAPRDPSAIGPVINTLSLQDSDPAYDDGRNRFYRLGLVTAVQVLSNNTSSNTWEVSFYVMISEINSASSLVGSVHVSLIVNNTGDVISGGLQKTSRPYGNNVINGGTVRNGTRIPPAGNPNQALLWVDNVVIEDSLGEQTTLPRIYTRWKNYSDDESIKVETSIRGSLSITTTGTASSDPITNLRSRNHKFNPEVLDTPVAGVPGYSPRRTYMQYIGEGQSAYANNQFSSVSDRNLYYVTRSSQSRGVDGNWPAGKFKTTHSLTSGFFATNSQFADYVGVRMTIFDLNIITALSNDENHVFNANLHPSNDYGLTGSDSGDYTWALQDRGVRFGVLTNVYNRESGSMPSDEWKSRYSNTSFTDSYFAITKRTSWDDISASVSKKVSIADGDCYIGYTYKRVMQGLGIPETPTATDPDLYKIGNRDTGLFQKGFVFPLVTENNFNTALRTFDKHSEVDTALYGKNRSFYPVDNIKKLRESRQPESTGYNHGYDYDNSDREYYSLNDRAPSFSINFGNRVMVSATSVAGSFANGYTDFSGLNFRDYNRQLGQITAVITHDNNVYSIFENGVGIIPLNQRTMVTEQTGGVFLDDSQVMAEKMQIISTEVGSTHQFSIIKTDLHIYGVDFSRNKIWRIETEGGSHRVVSISDFAVQTAINAYKVRAKSNPGSTVVKANYDRESDNVIFTYLSKDEDSGYNTSVTGGVGDKGTIATIMFSETLNKWTTRLSWNPLFLFSISNDTFSFDSITDSIKDTIWKHYSTNVPYCNFYGNQEKFIFEFMVVDNPAGQKILDNMLMICNRSFPGRVTYGLLEDDVDYETFNAIDNGYVELTKQRHEPYPSIGWTISTTSALPGTTMTYLRIDEVSKEESERIVGGYIEFNSVWYIIGNSYLDVGTGLLYNEILDQNGNNIFGGVPIGWTFTKIEYGIIHQNMEYMEDHLYLEVGKDDTKTRVRDKAIRVRVMYEGYDYVTVQSIISMFTYSFG